MPQTRQLAAIMFTDIVGYTALMGDDEDNAFELLNKNRQLQKPIIEQYGGRWIKELGDGVMASFSTVTDAVKAAIKIQDDCNNAGDFQLRIGIHLGEVVFEDNDVFGDGVNIASRIQAIALPGAIYISESVHNNIANKKEINTRFVGAETLKNVSEPVRIYEIRIQKGQEEKEVVLHNEKPKSNKKSIAVLPFVDMSAARDQEYLGDGLAEELINVLSQISELKVIGRTSSFSFKKKEVDLKSIGTILNTASILEGSIQKSGNRIRITAQLINAESGYQIWSKRYDREMDDIFSIQDDITEKIAGHLKLTLLGNIETKDEKKPTKNMQAYELLLQGKFLLQKKGEGLEKALEYFQKAVDLDPHYPDAYFNLGRTHMQFGMWRFISPSFVKAKTCAEKALVLDPNHTGALFLKASVHFWYEWDWGKAEAEFDKAKSTPSYQSSSLEYNAELFYRAFIYNDFDYAIHELQRKTEIDPLNLGNLIELGMLHVYGRRYNSGREILQNSLNQDPNVSEVYRLIARSYFFEHRYEEALEYGRKAYDLAQGKGLPVLALMEILAALNKKGELLHISEKFQTDLKTPALIHALINIALENFDKAFEWMEQALVDKDYWLVGLKYLQDWDPIRSDPRFKSVLDRMKFPEKTK